MKRNDRLAALGALLLLACQPGAEEADTVLGSPQVTKDNYVIAETDWYFSEQQEKAAVNTWVHNGPVSMDNQDVIRSNRDVMYSLAVVDVSEGATFSVPAREAFQIIHIMDEQHLSHRVVRAGESLTITPDDLSMGTHVYLLARTRITEDAGESAAAQQRLSIEANSANPYVSKGFAEEDVEALRDQMTAEFIAGEVRILEHRSFGLTMSDVEPTSYLYAAAVGWGGLPSHTAQYLPTVNGQGQTICQKYTMPRPALQWDAGGFFSLTTYDAEGWIVEENFYVGQTSMQDNGDSFTMYVNCPDVENSIETQEGWTGVFRFYLPENESEFIEFIDSIRDIEMEDIS